MTIQWSVYRNHEEASRQVADLFAETLGNDPACNLGLATGSTPLLVYADLCQRHRSGGLDFSRTTTFNLDEYIGLPPEHSQSYRTFMNTHLFNHVNIPLAQTHLPNVHTDDPAAAANEYEQLLHRSRGIDWQLLGIGTNGHIAFNEPGSTGDSITRVVDLAASTIESNSRFFDSAEQVPRRAITMGIGSILRAKRIILLASGESKAAAVAGAIRGPIGTDNPASFLQRHDNVLFVLDEAAASAL